MKKMKNQGEICSKNKKMKSGEKNTGVGKRR